MLLMISIPLKINGVNPAMNNPAVLQVTTWNIDDFSFILSCGNVVKNKNTKPLITAPSEIINLDNMSLTPAS